MSFEQSPAGVEPRKKGVSFSARARIRAGAPTGLCEHRANQPRRARPTRRRCLSDSCATHLRVGQARSVRWVVRGGAWLIVYLECGAVNINKYRQQKRKGVIGLLTSVRPSETRGALYEARLGVPNDRTRAPRVRALTDVWSPVPASSAAAVLRARLMHRFTVSWLTPMIGHRGSVVMFIVRRLGEAPTNGTQVAGILCLLCSSSGRPDFDEVLQRPLVRSRRGCDRWRVRKSCGGECRRFDTKRVCDVDALGSAPRASASRSGCEDRRRTPQPRQRYTPVRQTPRGVAALRSCRGARGLGIARMTGRVRG